MTIDRTSARIIDYSMEKFFTFGFSRVTMEEIASGLRISKKTLYKHFNNKLDLFECVINEFFRQTSEAIDLIMKKNVAYDVKLKLFLDVVGRQMERLNFDFVSDAKYNAPEAWDLIVSVRKKGIDTNFTKLIKEGKQKGLIKRKYDDKFILDVFLGAFERVTNSESMFKRSLSLKEVNLMLISMLMHGILGS